MTRLRIGSAVADITPDWSLTLAGFAARTKPAEGIAQPLKVRVAVLESEDDAGETARAVVVSADLLWWGSQLVSPLRQDIANLVNAPTERVLLSATHTHSGPQTATRASKTIGEVDPRFLDLLRERTFATTRQAIADLEPVTVSRSTGTHDLGFNRRYDRNPHGTTDPTLTVVRFARTNDTIKTLFVHYTCHPVITQEYLISGEFCGVAMSALEAELGATALYLQGCCGDINPGLAGEQRSLRGTNTHVVQQGKRLATAVERLLATPGTPLDPVPLRAEQAVVDLPFAPQPSTDELEAGQDRSGVEGEWYRALLAHPDWRMPTIPLTLQRLDIANGCSLLAMNGEIVVEYGLRIRKRSGGTILPMGYTNGMTGYVPTARQIAEGGYEAGGAIPYFFLPAPFDPSMEEMLNAALDRLVDSRPT